MPRLVDGLEQVFTDLGIIGAGYKLFFFETTTTTQKTTYSDVGLTVANPNPVVCDSSGRPEFDIWGDNPSTYKMVLGTPDSVIGDINPIVTVDPINDLNAGSIIVIDPLPAAYWGLTTGSSTAYVLNPALVPITSYDIKQCFFIDIHTACGANPTLDVNTIGAVAIKKKTGQGTKVAPQANDLQAGRYIGFFDGTDFVFYNTRGEPLYLGSAPTLTIDSGVVAITNISANYIIDTESAAATDDLDTINGGVDGEKIIIGIANDARNVILKHNTGNIFNPNTKDIELDLTTDKVELVYNEAASLWIITSFETFTNSIQTPDFRIPKVVGVFNGSDATPTFIGVGISSITDHGSGSYTLNFSTDFANTNFAVQITAGEAGADKYDYYVQSRTVSSVRINLGVNGAYSGSSTTEPNYISILIFGDQ
jgi:hypothetical protein